MAGDGKRSKDRLLVFEDDEPSPCMPVAWVFITLGVEVRRTEEFAQWLMISVGHQERVSAILGLDFAWFSRFSCHISGLSYV